MQVFDQRHARLPPALGVRQAPHGGEDLALVGLRVHAGHRPLGVGHAEEIEEERRRVGQLGVEQQDLAGDLLARRQRGVLLADAEVAA